MAPLRFGIIGTGSVVREIYQYLYFRSAYSNLIQVEAICDTDSGAMNEFGDANEIPADRRFTDYREMIEKTGLDAVAVNTPDSLHRQPVVDALDAGLDVLLPKPTADTVADAHAILGKVHETGRFLGVDFHKRENPIVKEAKARVGRGEYGRLQSGVMYMVDKLLVANPNHTPRFFSSPDFAEKNTPVSFLTSHMADMFMWITGLKPVSVRAVGYKQKLPSLSPIPVNGYDLVDTEVVFERGAVCHIITGWAIPDTAHATTVQTNRMIFTDGLLDLRVDQTGYHEITASGIEDRNILFRTFETDGMVSGFGMDCPGKILANIGRYRRGEILESELTELLSPMTLGFYTTLVCECAHASLAGGNEDDGVVFGVPIEAATLLVDRIGRPQAATYL